MKVTVEEIQQLRNNLTLHREKHERLVTQMQTLRESCRELRKQIAEAYGTTPAEPER